jgi:hypothetical protein
MDHQRRQYGTEKGEKYDQGQGHADRVPCQIPGSDRADPHPQPHAGEAVMVPGLTNSGQGANRFTEGRQMMYSRIVMIFAQYPF